MTQEDANSDLVAKLFAEALTLAREKRLAWLATASQGNAAEIEEVKLLLEAHEGADDYFDNVFEIALDPKPSPGLEGRKLGAYLIVKKIGTGGMGAVYLAERADDQYQRQVAIKVLSADAMNAKYFQRFEREKHILARLDHPNIARLLDAGTSEEGTPYIVMDYVRGVRIDNFCSGQNLPIRQRLALLEGVCDAIAQAHSQFIVHRDLKPQNILVTPGGQAKLLDFGIGKFLSETDGENTRVEDCVLTPQYAAPEQWRRENVSAATDVYSIGVVLYKLLCGVTPFDPDDLRKWYAIQETPPEAPTMLARIKECAGADIPLLAKRRGVSVNALRRALRGEIQAIVGKAISIEPARRYNSVDALWADIDGYLHDRPVKARRPSAWYRSRKWLYRERWRLSGAGLILALLGIVAIQNRLAADRATRQADLISVERDNADTVANLLADMYRTTDPNRAEAGSITVRDALARNAGRILKDLDSQPEVQRRLAFLIGKIHSDLELYQEAMPYLLQVDAMLAALAAERTLSDAEAQQQANVSIALTQVLKGTGRYAEAHAMADRAQSQGATALGAKDERTLDIMNSRTEIFEAEQETDKAIIAAEAAASYADLNPTLDFGQRAVAYNNLAIAYKDRRPPEQVAKALEATLRFQRSKLPDTHPQVMRVKANLASAYQQSGQLDKAADFYRQVMHASERQGTRPNHSVAQVAYVLGAMKLLGGSFEEAFADLSNALKIQLHYEEADDYNSITVALALATSVDGMRHLDGADERYRSLLALAEGSGADLSQLAKLHIRIAGVAIERGQLDAAAQSVFKARQILSQVEKPSAADLAYLDAIEVKTSVRAVTDFDTRATLQASLATLVELAGPQAMQSRRIRHWLGDADE